VRLSV